MDESPPVKEATADEEQPVQEKKRRRKKKKKNTRSRRSQVSLPSITQTTTDLVQPAAADVSEIQVEASVVDGVQTNQTEADELMRRQSVKFAHALEFDSGEHSPLVETASARSKDTTVTPRATASGKSSVSRRPADEKFQSKLATIFRQQSRKASLAGQKSVSRRPSVAYKRRGTLCADTVVLHEVSHYTRSRLGSRADLFDNEGVSNMYATTYEESDEYLLSSIKDTIFNVEYSMHGFVMTLLHSVAVAISSILTRHLAEVPKAKIAFYVAFTLLTGSMPGAFTVRKPLGALELQPLLMLRAFFGISATMFKATALVHLHVSDVVAVFALAPIGVSIGSWLFLHEKIHCLQWLSIFLTMISILMIVRPVAFAGGYMYHKENLVGLLFALGGVLSMIQLFLVTRYMRNMTRRRLAFNGNCNRVLLSLVFALLSGSFSKLFSGRLLGSLTMMSHLNFTALFFLNKALEIESAVLVTTVKLCGDVVFSMVLQSILLNDYPDMWDLAGGTLLVLSAVLVGLDKLMRVNRDLGVPLQQLLFGRREFSDL